MSAKTEQHDDHTAFAEALGGTNAVYVKPVDIEEVSRIVPPGALEAWDRTEPIFALHDAAGQRVALVEGRDAAFAAARAHALEPLSLH